MSDIRDYDLFYFDDSDLSWEAEDRAIRRCAALFADLGVTVELRNQARVHLWYEMRFGHPSPRLLSSRVVPSYSGPPRRYYRITPLGRDVLAAWRETWLATRAFVDTVVQPTALQETSP